MLGFLQPLFPSARKRSSFVPLSTQHATLRRNNTASHSVVVSLFSKEANASKKSILIFGGGSTLGKEVVATFSDANWRVYTLDFYDASVECGGVNGCALPLESHVPISLALPAAAPARVQVDVASKCLLSSCAEKFDVVLNATLGFTAAGLNDENLFETMDYMYRTSVESSLVTARLASTFMREGGLFLLIGSVAALPETNAPKMLGFGSAKASVHQMVRLLSASVGSDLPNGSSVVAIVPEVLDTPLHRSMNDGHSAENWTPCDVVASKLLEWAQYHDKRPPNGALVSISTSANGSRSGRDSSGNGTTHKFRLIRDSTYVQSTAL